VEERKGGREGSAQRCDTDGEREGKTEFDRAAAGGEGDKGARDKRTEEKRKRDFPRTYARFQKTAGARL
jgi:hypothetical protein